MSAVCRRCGKDANDIRGWLQRVNENGELVRSLREAGL